MASAIATVVGAESSRMEGIAGSDRSHPSLIPQIKMKEFLIFLWIIAGFIAMAFCEAYIEGKQPWASGGIGWRVKLSKNFMKNARKPRSSERGMKRIFHSKNSP